MTTLADTTTSIYLVRYGSVPEVARFATDAAEDFQRGMTVIVETERGLQSGTVLERLKPQLQSSDGAEVEFKIVRRATDEDQQTVIRLNHECEAAFPEWCARITRWELNLELVDLEWTLDHQKLILYVLCERGPDSTKLALQAAASGLGVIEVQPVSGTGLVTIPQSSCGSKAGGCGCHESGH